MKGSLFGQKQTKILMDLLVYVVLSLAGIIFIMPFAWMVANSFKDIRGIYTYPPEFIPEVWHFENYTEAWTMTHFDAGFLNSAWSPRLSSSVSYSQPAWPVTHSRGCVIPGATRYSCSIFR